MYTKKGSTSGSLGLPYRVSKKDHYPVSSLPTKLGKATQQDYNVDLNGAKAASTILRTRQHRQTNEQGIEIEI